MERIKFTSIDSFTRVYNNIKGRCQFNGLDEQGKPVYDSQKPLPVVEYKGTVKLHGTCAGISFQDGGIVTLSKERIVTPEKDNSGFANWVHSKSQIVWNSLLHSVYDVLEDSLSSAKIITLFGEWCGQGVQHKTAIAECPPLFVIFGVRIGNETDNGDKAIGWVDMSLLKDRLIMENERIYNSEFFGRYDLTLDWENPDNGQKIIEKATSEVDESCPVAHYMGVEGGGEGIVWTPKDPNLLDNPRFWFKTKGCNLQQTQKNKDSDIEHQTLESVQQIIKEFMTLNRLERGMSYFDEAGIEKKSANTRLFIEFIINDIIKDAEEHIEALDVSRKDLYKSLSKEAGKWFNNQLITFN